MTAVRAILADLHLGRQPSDLDRFRHIMSRLRQEAVREVIFLGDLFVTLVGLERFWDATVRAGLAELAAARAAGCRVVMVEGNREFFLDEPVLDPFRDRFGLSHSFAAGGRRFLLEHGDRLNPGDRAYRFWRSLSKSGPARIWARLLPGPIARRIVRSTEDRLGRTNFSYRRRLPAEPMTERARRYFDAGVDVVLWGHFHRHWELQDGGRVAHVVPSWQETDVIARVADDGRLSFDPPLHVVQVLQGSETA